jgi:uncharacterized membrane protein YgcG
MKSLRSLYLFAALVVGSAGVSIAQDSDDLYFFAKDRDAEMVAKRASTAKLNAVTMRDVVKDESMRSKFSNPDYQANANVNTTNLPYFRKDYRRDYSFNSLYASNTATNNRFGFFNNPYMNSLSMGMGMMWGSPMMWNNPAMMNSMMWNDPWMMNSMMWNNPAMMNSMMWNDPWMMNSMMWNNPAMMNSMMWNDPWMMNRMAWGNPWMMNGWNTGFGWNSWNRWNMGWGNGFGGWNNMMLGGRNMICYNNVTNNIARAYPTIENSATRPTSGDDYANYIRSSSDYGSYANSSVGNSSTYGAVEYKGGTANSYFYGTPNTANGSGWGTRSVDYNNGGSYNNNRTSSSWSNSTNSGFGSSTSGYGSYGGGSRSTGGRGGRGN